MQGKTIELNGKVYIQVGNEAYQTTYDIGAFKRAYPALIGEPVTDATGTVNMWRGQSGVGYQVTGEKVITTKAVIIEPGWLSDFMPAPKPATRPLPIPPPVDYEARWQKAREEERIIKHIGEGVVVATDKIPVAKPKPKGRQKRK